MQNYEPVPPAVARLNDAIVSLGTDLVDVAHEYSAGLDNRDISHIGEAARRLPEILANTRGAQEQIDALRQP
jgi:hypothetical protein